MTRDNRDRTPKTADADDRPLSYTPGDLEDKETASARANREQQRDTTSLSPRRAEPPEEDTERPGEHGDTRQAQQKAKEPTERLPGFGTAADPLR